MLYIHTVGLLGYTYNICSHKTGLKTGSTMPRKTCFEVIYIKEVALNSLDEHKDHYVQAMFSLKTVVVT